MPCTRTSRADILSNDASNGPGGLDPSKEKSSILELRCSTSPFSPDRRHVLTRVRTGLFLFWGIKKHGCPCKIRYFGAEAETGIGMIVGDSPPPTEAPPKFDTMIVL